MTCSSCGAENRPGRKFCSRCGAALAVACPVCGAPNDPGDLFCGECGTPLPVRAGTLDTTAASAAATQDGGRAEQRGPAAERRLVSVLFADLVGFTTLSESRDPEEVRDLLTRYFDTCRDLVEKYGGVVEKFIGDAVMAVWGTPTAHEDDAERAVRTALDLTHAVEALGATIGAPDLRARVGILTGEAAVTLGAKGQGMVAGDLVNTASRLQSAASPGTVLVGESTHLATNRTIAYEATGEHDLRGKALPIRAWRALRVVAGRQGFQRSEALEPPFVGRDEELAQVKELFHAAARERRPRLLSIMGIGGIGKSRLAWEFFKYIDGLAETVYWHQGRSPAYGEGVTFWALTEMVQMRARIAEIEDPRAARDKLTRTLGEYVPDPEDRGWIEPCLAHLLGLEESPAVERQDLFAAWRTFFERVADQGPVVMVFEDLQWSDPGLIDFVEYVLEWSRSSPIFIVTLSRPELMDRRPTWGAGQRNFTSLHLEPLPDDAMRRLLTGLAPGLPEAVVQQILDRAEGVPLYAVETVRMLVDQGRLTAAEGAYRLSGSPKRLDVPDTLHALIAARLDALDPADRSLLQDAAVLGKTFTVEAVAAVTGLPAEELEPRLRGLVRRELLTLDDNPRSPERGQYGFVQSLIREVAYQTLSRRDRQSRHVTAAGYFAGLQEEEVASVIASHYLEAYRSASEGPEAEALVDRALDALLAAADRASSLGSNRQALAYIEEGIAVARDPARVAVLRERGAEAASREGRFDVAEQYLARAVEWYRGQGDLEAERRATARLGGALLSAGHVERGIETLEAALAGLSGLQSDPSLVDLMAELARAYMLRGDTARTVEWADRALVRAEALDLLPIVADALITKGIAMYDAGRWREGLALLRGAESLADEHGLGRQRIRALHNLSDLLTAIDPPAATATALMAVELSRRLGLRQFELRAISNAGQSSLSSGEWASAAAMAEEALSTDLLPLGRMEMLLLSGAVAALRGDSGRANAGLAEARSLLGEMTDPQYEAAVLDVEALAALTAGEEAMAHERALAAVATTASTLYAVRDSSLAVRAALWMGDLDRAKAALRLLEEVPVHSDWVEGCRRTARAGVAALEGREEEASGLYRAAIQLWRDLKVPFDLAMCVIDALVLLGMRGLDEDAIAEARGTLDRLGASPMLARLDAAMSAAGRPV